MVPAMPDQQNCEACRTAARLRACRAFLRAWHPAINSAMRAPWRNASGAQAAGRGLLGARSARNCRQSAAPDSQIAIISRTLCHGIGDRLRAAYCRTMRTRPIGYWWSVLTACGAAAYPVNFAHFRPCIIWSAWTRSGPAAAVVESDQIRPGNPEYRYIGAPIF